MSIGDLTVRRLNTGRELKLLTCCFHRVACLNMAYNGLENPLQVMVTQTAIMFPPKHIKAKLKGFQNILCRKRTRGCRLLTTLYKNVWFCHQTFSGESIKPPENGNFCTIKFYPLTLGQRKWWQMCWSVPFLPLQTLRHIFSFISNQRRPDCSLLHNMFCSTLLGP